MTVNVISSSLWDQVKKEGFVSILGKLLFLILVYGLLLLLILEKEGGGIDWIFAQFPILEVVRDVSHVGFYIFWLLSLWIGFKFGKHVGMTRGAARERNRMGIPF
jgi:hypothetical protein